jgi:hypothetical protein
MYEIPWEIMSTPMENSLFSGDFAEKAGFCRFYTCKIVALYQGRFWGILQDV